MLRSTLSLLIVAAAATIGCSTTYKASGITGIRTRTVAANDGYATGTGVVVTSVDEDTDAYKGGVRTADLIKSVNGAAIDSPEDFADAVLKVKDGGTVTFKVANAQKQEKEVAVKKQDAPAKKKSWIGVSFPFLLYREAGDTSGTSLLHFNVIRFSAKPKESGFMLLELLGYKKKADGWGVRILFLTFGSASMAPEKGHNPDI